ncbi:MAG: DUF21 domain-containing protein [archaeon]|nr:DUF21 domain-containing protein [archaeon]
MVAGYEATSSGERGVFELKMKAGSLFVTQRSEGPPVDLPAGPNLCDWQPSEDTLNCSGATFIPSAHSHDAPLSPTFWTDIVISIMLVLVAGLMSGLTMGLMSMDLLNMKIIEASGSESERKYAARIRPIIQKHHWLLVTLLMANAIAMEALPLFLDRVAGPIISVVISVTAVLIFGEA